MRISSSIADKLLFFTRGRPGGKSEILTLMFQWVVLTAVNCQSWWACTYLLNGLKEIIGRNQDGLYRDDMLAYLRNLSGPQTTSIEKK